MKMSRSLRCSILAVALCSGYWSPECRSGALLEAVNVTSSAVFNGFGPFLISAPPPAEILRPNSNPSPVLSQISVSGQSNIAISKPATTVNAGDYVIPPFSYNAIVTLTANGASVVSQPNVFFTPGLVCQSPAIQCTSPAFSTTNPAPFSSSVQLPDARQSVTGSVALNSIGNSGIFDILPEPIGTATLTNTYLKKDNAFLLHWNRIVEDLKIAQTTLEFLSFISDPLGFLRLKAIIPDDVLGTIIDIALSIAVIAAALVAAGSSAAAAVTVLPAIISLVGAFAAYQVFTAEKILNDPPDSNYAQIFSYSGQTHDIRTVFGSNFDAHIETLIDVGTRMTEASQGVLVSMERYQGALIAAESASASIQLAAVDHFYQDSLRYDREYADLVSELPNLLQSFGISDQQFSSSEQIAASISSLGSDGVPDSLKSIFLDAGITNVRWDDVHAGAIAMTQPPTLLSTSAFESLERYATLVRGEPFAVVSSPNTLLLLLPIVAFVLARQATHRHYEYS